MKGLWLGLLWILAGYRPEKDIPVLSPETATFKQVKLRLLFNKLKRRYIRVTHYLVSNYTFLGWTLASSAFAQSIFAPVTVEKVPQFPAFHQLNPDYQLQWWYVTANLQDQQGRQYGVQFTLFHNAVEIEGKAHGLFFAHAALSSASQYFNAERYARADMGHAGVQSSPWLAFLDHWQFKGSATTPLPGQINVVESEFAFQLKLSDGVYVRQGDHGYSAKNASGSLASYYYSAPFIEITGNIVIGDETIAVTGQGWYDRELSSGLFGTEFSGQFDRNKTQHSAGITSPTSTLGWDWLSLHLDQQTALMLYRVRSDSGEHLAGVLIDKDGSKTPLNPAQIQWQVLAYQTLNGHSYPLEWQLKIPSHKIDLTIKPINDKQLFDGSVRYWEGAVTAKGSHTAQGYLELVGY